MPEAPSTTDLVQIKEIREGVIVMKDDSLRALVQVSAINFELRSSDEQAAILQQFSAFLNAIDFPVQMVVHSRRFDISTYITGVQEATAQLSNELLKIQAGEYIKFVTELAELANIMAKNFYVAIPMSLAAIAVEGEPKKGFFAGIFGSKKAGATAQRGISPERLAAYKSQLQQRADLIIGGLSGMGLKGHMMSQEEVSALFLELYNPIVPASQPK